MRSIETKIKRIIVGKVEPDEDLIIAITEMVQNHHIKSGLINCIGALKKFTVGYFNLESKEYERKTIEENIELVSCIGNISYKDNEPIIHLHLSIGNRDYSTIGGHLFSPSIVSITGEVYIIEIDNELHRDLDPKLNLSLLNL
ncbi:MAG: PPC domain-containing DNA-binding protein [Candidatus Thorarchaeota archaeon]